MDDKNKLEYKTRLRAAEGKIDKLEVTIIELNKACGMLLDMMQKNQKGISEIRKEMQPKSNIILPS